MQHKKAIEKLKHEIMDKECAIDDILDEYLGEGEGQWHFVTIEWECNESPVGWCIYNPMKNRAMDSCIFCHQPKERG